MTESRKNTVWRALAKHQQLIRHRSLSELFATDPQRFQTFSLTAAGLTLDYSKNHITAETLALLEALSEERQVNRQLSAMFRGENMNFTENRPALHTALRARLCTSQPAPSSIVQEVQSVLHRMATLVDQLQQQRFPTASNQAIRDVVNIGIGGSDLGPRMAVEALQPYAKGPLTCHFVANMDGIQIHQVLGRLNPARTLVIISSKSFTTPETHCNAELAKQWLAAANCQQHMLAVTANPARAAAFGIPTEHILPMWDWVGGRYSLWSAIGLPIAMSIGIELFQAFLDGARAMDEHVLNTPFQHNLAQIMAAISLWYRNFWHTTTQAVLPYQQLLADFPAYLQQLVMESNGKSVTRDDQPCPWATGYVLWGDVGTNGQHAFHQLLHQGQQLVPVDFIVAAETHSPYPLSQRKLFANCLSQSRVLAFGKSLPALVEELRASGMPEAEAKRLATHKMLAGNRPSNTLLMKRLTPTTLGALIALYEHKTVIESFLWQINAFDQFGVELGKQVADEIEAHLQQANVSCDLDSSTCGLVDYFHKSTQLGAADRERPSAGR